MLRSKRRVLAGSNPLLHWPAMAASFIASLDFLQLAVLFFLLGSGLLFVYSTDIQHGGGGFFYRQLCWIGAGSAAYLAAAIPDYRKPQYRILTLIFYLTVIIMLLLVPAVGVRVYGATRWLRIGAFRLQPSEFAKPALVFLLAAMFSSNFFNINRFRCMVAGSTATMIPFLLIAIEPDLGSAFIMLPIFISMVFCAGLKWRYILLALCLLLLIGTGAVLNELYYRPLLKDYQHARLKVFLQPGSNRSSSGYNVYQSKLAVGSGGWSGKGIGNSTQSTLGFLPRTVSNNDFIFSVIAEETGFLGCLALLAAYGALLYSILRSALLAGDPFGRNIGIGIAAIFFTHLFVNIGMSIGVVPVTGLSLPFVSYGGSFIITGMMCLGIMQSIYRFRELE